MKTLPLSHPAVRLLSGNRDFRHFCFSVATGDVALNLWFLVTAWVVLRITNSPAWVGWVLGVNAVPIVLLTLFGGAVADRVSKVRIVGLGRASYAVVALATALIVQGGASSPWPFLLLSLGIGTAYAFENPAAKAAAVEIVGRRQLVTANALNELAEFTGEVGAPLLVALLLTSAGAGLVYGIATAALIVATILMLRIPSRAQANGSVVSSVRSQVLEGLRYILKAPPYPALMVVAMTAIFGAMLFVLLPGYARDVLQVGAAGFGLLSAAYGAGLATGSLILAMIGDVPRKAALMLVAFAISDVGLAAFAWSKSYPLSALLLFVVGFGAAIGGNMVVTLFQTQASNRFRGRTMGVYALIASVFPLGTVLGGSLASVIGAEPTLTIAAIAGLLIVSVAFARSPVLRRL